MKTGAQGTRLLAIIRKWGPILAIALLMIVGFVQGWYRHVSLDSLVSNRDLLSSTVNERYWLMLGGYGLLYIAAVALSFPGASLLTIAGGFLFGWLIGGMITVVSATLGASLVFLAARSAFGGFLRERAGGFADRFSAGFREDGFNYLLFLRLVPLFPFWLVNVMPALFNLRLGPYALATLIGILPGTFAYAFIGAGLDSVIVAQRQANPACATNPDCTIHLDPSALITGELIAALIAMGVIALIPPLLKARKKHGKT